MRTKQGIVTSAKMQKTVTVAVHRSVMHSKYRKRFRVTKKFLADSGDLTVREGDTVLIGETKPLSKRKHFRVLEVLVKGTGLADVSLEDEMRAASGKAKGSEGSEGSEGSDANRKLTSHTSKTSHTSLSYRQ